jgi:hypothetical protein
MARDWPDAFGGVIMVALVSSPSLVYALALDDDRSLRVRIAYLVWELSALLVLALVAPIVGKRRRDVLWAIVPFWGWIIAWRFGVGLTRVARERQVSASPSPEPARSAYTEP